MKKQKICIIGGGLTGLVTAISLSKLNIKVDLISDDINTNKKSSRTLAISQSNFDFLNRLNFQNNTNIKETAKILNKYSKQLSKQLGFNC